MIITIDRHASAKDAKQDTHTALLIYLNRFEPVRPNQITCIKEQEDVNGHAVSIYEVFGVSGRLKYLFQIALKYYRGIHTSQKIISVYDKYINKYYEIETITPEHTDLASILKTYVITMLHYSNYEIIVPFEHEHKYKSEFDNMNHNIHMFFNAKDSINKSVVIGLTSMVCDVHNNDPIHHEVLDVLCYALSSCLKIIFQE